MHCCRGVKLNIQGQESETNRLIVPLGDAQIILGTVWLRSLAPTIWDFPNHTLTYWQGGKPITLRGVKPGPVEMIEGESLGRQGGAAFALQGGATMKISGEEPLNQEIEKILEEFQDVYQVQGLPPPRQCDHRIPLHNPQLAVKIRPYRYPFHHKNEIERQVQEMLHSGIIRPSNSPFASLVVLVKKAVDNWRLCVDYRTLN